MRRTGYEASGAFNLIFVVEGRMFRFERMIERERDLHYVYLQALVDSSLLDVATYKCLISIKPN